VRGELVDTLADLMDRMQTGKIKPLKRVVIETTGLADPAPVLQSVMGNPIIAQNYRLDGVVTVVDAANGLSTLDHHEEAVKQVAMADRLVISKMSLATPDTVISLKARLRALNPRAPMIDGDLPEAGKAELFHCGLYDPATKIADVGRWLQDEAAADHDHDHDGHHDHEHCGHENCGHDHHHHHHHDENRHGVDIRSFSLVHDRPIDPMALEMFVDLLRSAHGEKLLRMKAIVSMSDNPDRPLILHGVQTVFHMPQRMAAWPDPSDRRTRMVLITKGLPEAFVRDLFDAFTGKPRIDRPDRQALEDNPLAVPGLRM
jgi:G3E family GTPase